MMRLFLPFILVATAIGLFMMYTNPTYQVIKGLQIENNSYEDALNKAQELRTVRDQLISKRNAFAVGDLDKLKHILPDHVDNIRLILDINNIASRHSLALSDVDLGDVSSAKSPQSGVEGAASQVGSAVVGFAVDTKNYDNFLTFLQDLEHSLRLVDISNIAFTTSQTGVTTFNMKVRTYWLH